MVATGPFHAPIITQRPGLAVTQWASLGLVCACVRAGAAKNVPLEVRKGKVGVRGAVVESQCLKAAEIVEGIPLAAPAGDVGGDVDGDKGSVVTAGVVRTSAWTTKLVGKP